MHCRNMVLSPWLNHLVEGRPPLHSPERDNTSVGISACAATGVVRAHRRADGAGGIAADSDTGYRVVKRVKDNIVEVIFK